MDRLDFVVPAPDVPLEQMPLPARFWQRLQPAQQARDVSQPRLPLGDRCLEYASCGVFEPLGIERGKFGRGALDLRQLVLPLLGLLLCLASRGVSGAQSPERAGLVPRT